MSSGVKVLGHSVHPMLIVFPLGLLATSVVWDLVRLATGSAQWGMLAFWTIAAGIVGALVAAVPGFFDWNAIPAQTRAKRIGFMHMASNLTAVALFALSLALRWGDRRGYQLPPISAMVWGWVGLGLASVGGWLGGELVETLGISVSDGANPDAPSSLSRRRHNSTRRPA
jgi:uncharacterized membrane protein